MDAQELLYLRLGAMRAVLCEGTEYTLRTIRRWYAERFATPLHLVGTDVDGAVPLEDVLLHFYESRYSNMSEKDRDTEVEDLLMTPEDYLEVGRRRDVEEVENWTFAQATTAQEQERRRREAAKKDKERQQRRSSQGGDQPLVPRAAPAQPKVVPEATLDGRGGGPPSPSQQQQQVVPRPLPSGKDFESQLPEDVHVQFVLDDELEAVDPFSLEKPTKQSKK